MLYVDGLHSLETSRQQPTAFSVQMSPYKEQPSVGHHIVPPGSRPRQYSRTASFRRLRVHKSNCALLHCLSSRQNVSPSPCFVLITTFRRISQHHYSGSFCSGNNGILQDLMSKASIRGNLTGFAPDIGHVSCPELVSLRQCLGESQDLQRVCLCSLRDYDKQRMLLCPRRQW